MIATTTEGRRKGGLLLCLFFGCLPACLPAKVAAKAGHNHNRRRLYRRQAAFYSVFFLQAGEQAKQAEQAADCTNRTSMI